MKIQNFKGIGSIFAATLALGLVTACQPVEQVDEVESETAAPDLDADDVDLEAEGGFGDLGHGFPGLGGGFGGLGGLGVHGGRNSLDFLAMIAADQLIPRFDRGDHYYGSNGKSHVSFRVLTDYHDAIRSVRPRFQVSVCGLGNDFFLDVAGVSIHEGRRGHVNQNRLIEAIINQDRPARLRVTNGCAEGSFRGRFLDGIDARERYQRIDEEPENFYYLVRSVEHPEGLCRGQLSRY